jgi:hypothetical protein
MSRETLAHRQAELVAALVAGGVAPDGFDQARVRATEEALLRKRAGEVGNRWPTLRSDFGPQWSATFAQWARGRSPQGSLRDGWDFARCLAAEGQLGPAAAWDLAVAEATYVYDGASAPRRRLLPALHRNSGGILVQVLGRVFRIGQPAIHR